MQITGDLKERLGKIANLCIGDRIPKPVPDGARAMGWGERHIELEHRQLPIARNQSLEMANQVILDWPYSALEISKSGDLGSFMSRNGEHGMRYAEWNPWWWRRAFGRSLKDLPHGSRRGRVGASIKGGSQVVPRIDPDQSPVLLSFNLTLCAPS
jgi:hypothetical protein